MIVKIKQCKYEDLFPLRNMRKESVALKDDGVTKYIGAFIESEIIGCVGYQEIGNKIRYKTDYVHPKYRGMGIYSLLFKEREKLFEGRNEITAFCTLKSLNCYLSHGFKKINQKKGITFVKRRKNNE